MGLEASPYLRRWTPPAPDDKCSQQSYGVTEVASHAATNKARGCRNSEEAAEADENMLHTPIALERCL
ncbi:hypothetical protein ACJQWK_05165 [Exserohilum turcicum]